MKKILPLAVVLTLSGICCIIAAYYCHFYHALYLNVSTELEQTVNSRVNDLQHRVEQFAQQRHFVAIRAHGIVLTTDKDPGHWAGEPTTHPGEYELGSSKSGWVISPELRLPAGSMSVHEFYITLPPAETRAIDAWISPPGQPEILAMFEQFSVIPIEGTNLLKMTVQAKPGASLKFPFTMVVVRDSSDQL